MVHTSELDSIFDEFGFRPIHSRVNARGWWELVGSIIAGDDSLGMYVETMYLPR